MDIKIHVVDNCAIVREGMRIFLDKNDGLTVVGTSTGGDDISQSLSESLVEHLPEILIFNFGERLKDGMDTVKSIRANFPSIQVIITVMQISSEEVIELLRTGVAGFVLSESVERDIMKAINAVYNGRRYLTKKISEKIVKNYISKYESILQEGPLFNLSIREREVLQLVAEGRSSTEIAGILCLTLKTVNTYRYRIMEKLGIDDLSGLVRFAIENGMTPA